jgi:uncharacterized membrane protein YdbT with pleckstrin-like domain
MAEEILWKGNASQVKNFSIFLICGLTCFLIVPIFIALWKYLQIRCKVYELTSERLRISEGIFSKKIEELELYRVKDLSIDRPFWLRLFGLENVHLMTSDQTAPKMVLDFMPQKVALGDKIRKQVDLRRDQKRVRELDID